MFGGEFDAGVRHVPAAVGEIARVSRDGPTRLGVAAERLESRQQRFIVQRGPLCGLVSIAHTEGTGAADLSPRFGSGSRPPGTSPAKMNTYDARD